MEDNYWHERWSRGETGWHQSQADPDLIAYFQKLPPTRVFVPLCGKSLDMSWLREHGHDVVGVELTRQACTEYMAESGLDFQEVREDRFTIFRGPRITIYNGNFFDLGTQDLGRIGAVYDRGALIAFPPKTRARYARHLMNLLQQSIQQTPFHFLQNVLERRPPDSDGPPFSVPFSELEKYYGSYFQLSLLNREQVDRPGPAESITERCIYDLRPNRSRG